MKRFIFCLLTLLLVLPVLTMAEDSRCEKPDPIGKFGYGLSEIALCWTEIPMSIQRRAEKTDPVSGFFVGLVEGTALGVRDVAQGTVDATFFMVPPYKSSEREQRFNKLMSWDKKFQEEYW
ncbi:MAG: hypothetical protein JW867_05110 [Candidatus Omnitrophica bacterium]|nr:hypothetical protein [Candidatus Omnitrophota bacterium]